MYAPLSRASSGGPSSAVDRPRQISLHAGSSAVIRKHKMHSDSLKARHNSFAHHSASHLPDREPAVPSSSLHSPPPALFLSGRWMDNGMTAHPVPNAPSTFSMGA